MKAQNTKLLLVFIGLVVLICNCGKSPLFNHTDAVEETAAPIVAADKKDCPLSFPQAGLCAKIDFDGPLKEDLNGATISFTNKTTKELQDPGTEFRLQVTMPEMSHPPKFPKIDAKKDGNGQAIVGSYHTDNINLFMTGKWRMELQLMDGKKVKESDSMEFDLH